MLEENSRIVHTWFVLNCIEVIPRSERILYFVFCILDFLFWILYFWILYFVFCNMKYEYISILYKYMTYLALKTMIVQHTIKQIYTTGLPAAAAA